MANKYLDLSPHLRVPYLQKAQALISELLSNNLQALMKEVTQHIS